MKREYKIGDIVIFTDKKYSDWWEDYDYGVSLYKKVAKIIDIDKRDNHIPYLLEFKEWINSYNEESDEKEGHCRWVFEKQFKSFDSLKFKKWWQK